MRPSRNQPPPKPPSSRGYFIFAIIFTLLAIGGWLAINQDNIREFRDTYRSREQARKKISETKALITRLKRRQQSLNYNGLESKKQMRERLGLHLPGEQVVFFEVEESATSVTAKAADTTLSLARQPESAYSLQQDL